MGQIRHGSATTTHIVRAAIKRSHASAAALSRTYEINPKTVLKWRKRATVEACTAFMLHQAVEQQVDAHFNHFISTLWISIGLH
ncbi:hypothetical protein [Martelella mangrovi]|uniref:IS481 family transposase n=1 Tax=Martelella mangrovi TaxID=1397477 RepID=A0ABV2IF80_9HYPH